MAIRFKPKYPHMGPKEAQIWDRFLATTNLKFIKIEYDVRVGPGNLPAYLKERYEHEKRALKEGKISPDEFRLTQNIVKMAIQLTQLRIDVVAETSDSIWIFEVKGRAGRSALGQLLSYHYWYVRQYRPRKRIRLGIVCIDFDRNLLPLFEMYNIYVFKVGGY